MAGAGGLEPPNAGIKILCLSHLTTPQFAVPGINRTHGIGLRSKCIIWINRIQESSALMARLITVCLLHYKIRKPLLIPETLNLRLPLGITQGTWDYDVWSSNGTRHPL